MTDTKDQCPFCGAESLLGTGPFGYGGFSCGTYLIHDGITRYKACYEKEISQLQARIAELKGVVVEYAEIILNDVGAPDGTGWIDSCARGDAVEAGDRLVSLGMYEIDETRGAGRRQFYRPIALYNATKGGE
jgi:hypothetical protein